MLSPKILKSFSVFFLFDVRGKAILIEILNECEILSE